MKRYALLAAIALLAATPGEAKLPPSQETEHVVKSGETLNGIANRAGVSREKIIEANGLNAPFVLRIGQKLKIPRERAPAAPASSTGSAGAESEHVVQAGETLNGIANRAGVGRQKIIEANGLEPPYVIRVGQKLKIPQGQASAAAPAPTPTPAPAPAAASDSPIAPEMETEHVVVAGETLGGIASRAKVPRVLIAEANGLAPPYVVRVGQRLKIPRTRHHTVEAGETGFGIAYTYGVPWKDISVASGIDPDAPVRTGQKLVIPTLLDKPRPASAPSPAAAPAPASTPSTAAAEPANRFIWPLQGFVRRGFTPRGQSNHHDGLDIRAPLGTAVRATAEGQVIFAGDKGEYGKLVIISHGDGWHSVYSYLSRITVKMGEHVNQGERIGLVGSTGLAKENELHFEMRHDNRPVDPRGELPEGP